ncbi:MAG: hypothetical protein HC825_04810 [Oscillatoriales cyanobacterium RM1_1_9]|nr:hypothetical protein [Oscillatoriales cyanobacterium RM1_1_9]
MAQNLLSTGIIDPNQWHLARVWLEVAALLRIAPRKLTIWTVGNLRFGSSPLGAAANL